MEDLQKKAIEAYEKSPLIQQDAKKRNLERKALQKVVSELGFDTEIASSEVEVDGVILTAHFDTNYNRAFLDRVPELDEKYALHCVNIRAHMRCRICGEMRHSGPMCEKEIDAPIPQNKNYGGYGFSSSHTRIIITVAPQIGQWLSQSHQCAPSNNRAMGFRANTD